MKWEETASSRAFRLLPPRGLNHKLTVTLKEEIFLLSLSGVRQAIIIPIHPDAISHQTPTSCGKAYDSRSRAVAAELA